MIDRVLSYIAEELDSYLGNFYEVPAGIVRLGGFGGEEEKEERNKVRVALLNVEREPAMGMTAGMEAEGTRFLQRFPAWHLNVYFVVAAVFEGKRYGEGVRLLSESIAFLQQHPMVRVEGGQRYGVEPVTLNFQELTNVWNVLGGRYYPSVVCKVRMVTYDGEGIGKTVERVR